MNSNNDLFLFLPAYNNIRVRHFSFLAVITFVNVARLVITENLIAQAIAAPPTDDSYDIVCLTAVPGSLWMLTNNGKIFMRTGINELTPYGYSWEELHLKHANSEYF